MIKRVLSWFHLSDSLDRKGSSSFTNSEIQRPHLVSDSAIIRNSILYGDIVVHHHAKIIDSHISGSVEIGLYSSVNGPNTDIFSSLTSIKIGKFCAIARKVSIQEYNHFTDRCSIYFMNSNLFGGSYLDDITSTGEINIGNDVWIGTHSVVLSGAQISDGAVVAAGSVVTGFVPPYAVVGGVPAKVIKYRFDHSIIRKLLEIRWWDWPIEKIMDNRDLFIGELNIEKLNKVL